MPRRCVLGALSALVLLLAACEVPVVETSGLSGAYASVPAGSVIAGIVSTFPQDAGAGFSPTGEPLTLASLEAPLADVQVMLLDAALQPVPNAPTVKTDAGGRFELAGLPLGRTFVLEVKLPDGRALRTLIATVPGGELVTISPSTTIAAAMLLTGLKDVPPAHDPRAFARLAHEVALYTTPAEFDLFREDRQLAAKVGAIAAGSREVWDLLVALKHDITGSPALTAEVAKLITQVSPRPAASGATEVVTTASSLPTTVGNGFEPGPVTASVLVELPGTLPSTATAQPGGSAATPTPAATATPTPTSAPTPTPTPDPTPTPTPNGSFVKTLAGTGTVGASNGATATFSAPRALVVRGGALWIADMANHRLRVTTLAAGDTASGTTTFAGDATGFVDGSGTAARFNSPQGLAWSPNGQMLLVADTLNDRIRVVTPSGAVTTLRDGAGDEVVVLYPLDLVFSGPDTVYVVEQGRHRVLTLTLDANGRATSSVLAGPQDGSSGFADGAGPVARFNSPRGLALDAEGNILLADAINNRIRRITPSGATTTIAGSGTRGFLDASAAIEGRFDQPSDVAVGSDGAIYVADTDNDRIRKIAGSASLTLSTLAGTGTSSAERIDGAVAQATFRRPRGLAVEGADRIYVADGDNNAIRVIVVKNP